MPELAEERNEKACWLPFTAETICEPNSHMGFILDNDSDLNISDMEESRLLLL